MSRHSTPEQVEQQYVEAMGPEPGRLFYLLWNECAWLHSKWGEYVTLFGSKPERIDLLNAAAALFFRIVQDSLWEDILLHIARLTDPPRSAGKDNFSLQRLPPIVDAKIQPCVKELLKTCIAKCKFAHDWRNRQIAHRDLLLALNKNIGPLAPASRRAVGEAIDSIAELLNTVELHYLRSTVAYGSLVGPPSNAEVLLYVIRDGLEADARRRKRLESGNLEPEDLNPLPTI